MDSDPLNLTDFQDDFGQDIVVLALTLSVGIQGQPVPTFAVDRTEGWISDD